MERFSGNRARLISRIRASLRCVAGVVMVVVAPVAFGTTGLAELCEQAAPPQGQAALQVTREAHAGEAGHAADLLAMTAEHDLGLLAGLDRDVGFAILMRGLAGALNDQTGAATLAMLSDSALFESSLSAWQAFAHELGMTPDAAFKELFARRALLVVGDSSLRAQASLRWSLAVEVNESFADRLRKRLAAVPRGLDAGVPVMQLAEESVRVLWLNTPLGGPIPAASGTTALSEHPVTLVFSPSGEDALAKSILLAHASHASLLSHPNDAISMKPDGASWPALLEPIGGHRAGAVLIRTQSHAGSLRRTETGWHARFVSRTEPGPATEPTLWSTDVLDALDEHTLAAFVGSPAAYGLTVDSIHDPATTGTASGSGLSPMALARPAHAPVSAKPPPWASVLQRLLDPARELLAPVAAASKGGVQTVSHAHPTPESGAGFAGTMPSSAVRVAFGLQLRSEDGDAPSDAGPPASMVLSVGVERNTPASPRGLAWSVSSQPAFGWFDTNSGRLATLPQALFAPSDLNQAAGAVGSILTQPSNSTPSAFAQAHVAPEQALTTPTEARLSSEVLPPATPQSAVRSVVVPLVRAGSVRPALLMDVLGSAGPMSSAPLGALVWLEHVRWVTTRGSVGVASPGLTVTDLAIDLVSHPSAAPVSR